MARRKNVKRIDPRYFLHETVNRNDDGSVLEEVADQIGPWRDRGPTGTVTMPAVGRPDPEDEDEGSELPDSAWEYIEPAPASTKPAPEEDDEKE